MTVGLVSGVALAIKPIEIRGVVFDVDTLVGASAAVVIGFQGVVFSLLTKAYGVAEGFLPSDRRANWLLNSWSFEKGLVVGGVLAVAGLAGVGVSVVHWHGAQFGELNARETLRMVVPSATALMMSCQMILGTAFLSILGIRRSSHPGTEDGAHETLTVADAVRKQDREPAPEPVPVED